MINRSLNLIVILTLALCAFYMASAQATLAQTKSNIKQKSQQLHKVNQRITHIQHALVHDKSQRSDLQKRLRQTEINIGLISQKLNQLKPELEHQHHVLTKLQTQQRDYQQQLVKQRLALAKEVRAAYMLGQHQYVKILLNQHNPAMISRIIQYFKYINQARLKIIGRLQQTLAKLDQTQQQIAIHTRKLEQLYQQQQTAAKQLQDELTTRKKVLAQVNARIKTRGQRLKQLAENKTTLQHLIKKLRRQAQSIQQPKIPFSKMRGRLHWPTNGRIAMHFNSNILDSHLQYNAVLISAPSDQAVRAVYPGKVVFASWLRGIGLLIIINHGHGFLTLYGHDHSLLKHTGDTVNAGEIIATVGNSGGNEKSGLYFQIRDNGKPLNPETWCK